MMFEDDLMMLEDCLMIFEDELMNPKWMCDLPNMALQPTGARLHHRCVWKLIQQSGHPQIQKCFWEVLIDN
jgi:hypothetical protein